MAERADGQGNGSVNDPAVAEREAAVEGNPAVEREAGGQAPGEPAEGGQAAAAELPTEVAGDTWRVTVSRDRNTAYLDFQFQEDGELPDPSAVLEAARSLDVPEEGLFSEDKLRHAFRNTERSKIDLKSYPICEDKDAGFTIDVSEDRLRATLTIIKGRGAGKPLVMKDLGAAIRSSGLKGMDLERLKTDLLTFYRSPAAELIDYELTTGKPATDGDPPELVWHVDFLPDEESEPLRQAALDMPKQVLSDLDSVREIPVDAVEQFAPVREGQAVAEIKKGEEAAPGVDVYGKTIKPRGEADLLKTFENVQTRDGTYGAACDGIVELWHIDKMACIRVRPHRDAQATVQVTPDAMLASVRCTEGQGTGMRLSEEMVRQALIDAEVIRGIDMNAVGLAVQHAQELGQSEDTVVARGQSPEDTGPGRLTFHVDLASGKGVSILENGRADYKNQDRFTSVKPGDLIAEILLPDHEPEDGWDVKGRPVKAKGAGTLKLDIGDGIRKEAGEKGRELLYAETAGELVYENNVIEIRNVYTIKGDVGLQTGNVKFPGSVNVTGSVTTGFYIMSSGTVKVADTVEGALVSAEESVHIQQGIRGAGKAVIRARTSITAAFAEQATLMAAGDIQIRGACLRCNLKSNGRIHLGSDKGRLVGGKARARNGVDVAELGSATGSQTSVSFGQDYLIGDKIELEEKEIESAKEKLMGLDAAIHAAEKSGERKALQKARLDKVRALKTIEKRGERLFWLRERFEQHFDSEVVVRGPVYPGVVLESHGRTHEISTEKRNIRFVFDQESGRIEETPLDSADAEGG